MGNSQGKSKRLNISSGTEDTESNLSSKSNRKAKKEEKKKQKNGQRFSKQVSQTSANSAGSPAQSPGSSQASPQQSPFQSPAFAVEHNNPNANHLKYRRSKSMDNVLEGTHFNVSTNCNGASNDLVNVSTDRRASMEELAHNARVFKPLVVGEMVKDGFPTLPPKRYSPRSSPKITRVSTPGRPIPDSKPRSSSPATNQKMGRQFVKNRLAKSFDDLKLIGGDVDQSLPNDTKPVIFLAMYDFDAINDDDLSFKKGDRLKKVVAGDTADWVVCINLTNGNKGYIPVNYVMVDDDSPQAQDWWFECSRTDAETWLMRLGIATGSFLVRHSTDKKTFVLSVRSNDGPGKTACVRHYKIHSDSDNQVFIGERMKFLDVVKLVKHYKESDDGLVCRLTEPCPRTAPVPHLRNIEISPDSIRRTERLGAGFFGEVWKGKFRGKLDIAIKMLKPGRMTPREFLREAKTMNKLRHVRLVQLLAVCTTCEPMLLITEFMPNGALLDYLRRDRRPRLEFQMMINMTRQVAEGMAYLESQSYIHRDLRAGNILVGEHLDVKVADFGLARVCDDGTYIGGGSRFPVKWTAPEAVLYSKFSIKSDVWSFGVLMYEIATFGREPYAGMSPSEAVQEVQKGHRLPKPSHGWPPGKIDPYYLMMQLCWKKDPKDRPSFFHLYNVFEDFDTHMEQSYREL